MKQNSPTAIQNSKNFPGTIPWTFVSGEESLFSFSENALKLFYSNTEFKKFPRDNTPDPRFMEEENLFSFPENVLKLSYINAEFKNFPGDNTPDFRFRGLKICFRSPKM